MKLKLTEKGHSTSRTTLQALGFTDEEITKLKNGDALSAEPKEIAVLIDHDMIVKTTKKAEVADGSGNI